MSSRSDFRSLQDAASELFTLGCRNETGRAKTITALFVFTSALRLPAPFVWATNKFLNETPTISRTFLNPTVS